MSANTRNSNTAFYAKNNYGNSVEKEVSEALSAVGLKHKVFGGTSPLQTYGDIGLHIKEKPVFVEVKGNRNYNDDSKRYNLYFEVFEGYRDTYEHIPAKRETLDLVGILNQLAFRKNTIFAHKLGTTNMFLVYSPQHMFEYLAMDQQDPWRRDLIVSEDADGQKGKFKLGARIKFMKPDTLPKDYNGSHLRDYATLTTHKHLARAIAFEANRAEAPSMEPATAYRHLVKALNPRLTKEDWWFYVPNLRKQ